MDVLVLGPTQLGSADGSPGRITSRRQRQLLVVLATRANRVVPAEVIADLLWLEDDAPADPAGTVQTTVSRLRRTLAVEATDVAIETSPSGYRLVVAPDRLDLDVFRRAGREAAALPPEDRLQRLEAALGLWRGEPLAELEHPDVEADRQELRAVRWDLAEARAAALLAVGRHAEAVLQAERVTAANPHREAPVATAVRALYAAGRQADALAAHRALRERLVEDLGVGPSPELEALEQAVLEQRLPGPVAAPDVRDPVPAGGDAAAPADDGTALTQRIHMAASPDGTRIAYAVSGSGPPLVKAATWMTHLDYDWESPVWRHWMQGLSADHTLVRYDERGCGLSDHDTTFSFDAWVDDLAVVVDAAGLDRFPLLGISQGGAVAIAYAVAHPERVTRLVLYGAYGQGRLARAGDEAARREADLNLELARVGWGTGDPTFRQVFTSQFMPDATRAQWEEFNELQRRTCSAENAVAFLRVFAEIDVLDLATRVRCPTLILHARDELRVPLENATTLARHIPDSELVPLPSRNHILGADEPAWPMFLAELDRFLGGDELDRAP